MAHNISVLHYMPKRGSWLDVAQIGLSALKLPCLNRRIHVHRNPEPVQWHYTTGDDGRGKVSVNIYDFLMLHGN